MKGAGGRDGSNEFSCSTWSLTPAGGVGQGSFSLYLSSFELTSITFGAGGATVNKLGDWMTGSGGGGVLINEKGPRGDDGTGSSTKGFGGVGYGAGGGGGGLDTHQGPRKKAGNGANGVVYVEGD